MIEKKQVIDFFQSNYVYFLSWKLEKSSNIKKESGQRKVNSITYKLNK